MTPIATTHVTVVWSVRLSVTPVHPAKAFGRNKIGGRNLQFATTPTIAKLHWPLLAVVKS